MPTTKKIYALVARVYAPNIIQSLDKVANFLKDAGHEVVYEAQTGANVPFKEVRTMKLEEIGAKAAAAIVLGGDGTMLGIARQLAPYSVPLIGINHGHLGFITDIPLNRMLLVLDKMIKGRYVSEQRFLVEGTITREGEVISKAMAFNEVVISRGAGAGMIDLRVHVDGHFMHQQHSDGMIISTPTGSTAYSLSAGGPMLHPNLGGIVLVSIAPHTLSSRPIVIPDTSEIVVDVVNARQPSISFDSQSFTNLQSGDQVTVRRAPHVVTFLHPVGWSYYDTLRNKLHWNEVSRKLD
ncbi:MAG: NAD kinase [Oxalobacter sp.]